MDTRERFALFEAWAAKCAASFASSMSSKARERYVREHVQQAALVGLWEACERYQEKSGVPFEAYARRRVFGEMRNELERLAPLRVKVTRPQTTAGDAHRVDDEDRLAAILARVARVRERQCLALLATGYTRAEIGQRLGVGERHAARLVTRASLQARL